MSKVGSPKISWFYAFFFVSGFCSLVYEVVWLRLTVAKFGVTTPTVSIMLSVFMAGLGLGSWGGGKIINRFQRSGAVVPLRLYALLEFIIGLSAVLVPALLTAGYGLLRGAISGLAWGSASFYLVSGSWITLSLLPWCTCMGATFPFAMAAIRQLGGDHSGRSFSYLYLANVLGAMAGTLIPAFILIELLGFRGTLYVGCALNMLLAGAVFLFSLTVPRYAARPETEEDAPQKTGTRPRTILVQLFATGICSMAAEVIWIREFTVYLGNVVYAFALILALYLGATFAGSAFYRRWARSHDGIPGTAWLLLGLSALLPLVAADPRIPIAETADTLISLLNGTIRTAAGIVPFSAIAGFLTPMLVDRWSNGVPELAGRAYATNVLGSILGPLVAGFWIVPMAGERWGLLLVAIPLFAIAFATGRRSTPRYAWASSVAAGLLLLIFTRDYSVKYPNPTILRDHTASVLANGEGMHKRLLVNGTGMTKLTPITKMMAHLPLAFHRGPARKGLVICMGMGTTFRSMLSWGIDATVIELVPSVPKLFGFFHPDAPQLLASGRAHIVVDDGRRFLERSSEQFDVMAIDPPPPIAAPTSSLLYSMEFYKTVKPHLRPDGVLQIWCPGGDSTTESAVTKAIQASFPYVRAFESLEGWGTHYLVSAKPLSDPDIERVAATMPAAAAKDMTEFTPDWTADEMLSGVIDDEYDVADIVKQAPNAPVITDNRAVNEYFLLRELRGGENNN